MKTNRFNLIQPSDKVKQNVHLSQSKLCKPRFYLQKFLSWVLIGDNFVTNFLIYFFECAAPKTTLFAEFGLADPWQEFKMNCSCVAEIIDYILYKFII